MAEILHSALAHHSKSVEKHQLIYSANKEAQGFYYIESGLVGLYRNTESGKEHLMRIYGPGEYFGYRSLFGNKIYHLTTRSLLESRLHHIHADNIETLNEVSPRTLKHMLTEVCTELGDAESRLSNSAAYCSKIRILDAIIHLFSKFDYYPWTTREIAEYSGTDTQTVIRFCKILKENELLDPMSRRVKPNSLVSLSDYREQLIK